MSVINEPPCGPSLRTAKIAPASALALLGLASSAAQAQSEFHTMSEIEAARAVFSGPDPAAVSTTSAGSSLLSAIVQQS